MYILHSYIIKSFISKFLSIIFGFILLFLIIDIIGNIDKFLESNLTQKEIFYFSLLSIPSFISFALPMSTLLACMFSIGQLQKNHELTAIKSCGVSLKSISISLIIIGSIISFCSFLFDNTIVTKSLTKKEIINKKLSRNYNKSNQNLRHSHIIYDKGVKKIMSIENYQFSSGLATNVVIQEFEKQSNQLSHKMLENLKIDSMIFIYKEKKWHRKGISRRNINDNMISTLLSNDTIFFLNEDESFFTEKDLNDLLPDSDQLNYWELKQISLKRPEQHEIEVDYNFKVAFSFTSIIMIFFGIGLSIRNPRDASTAGIGLGIITIFLYYIGIKIGQSMGYSQTLTPFYSVWTINIIFLSVGGWLFSRIRT
ncbi:MAG: hypothetical protein CMG59_06590 [Candidatus Marinimicrobia bacterium]|nr:hypothetical protein [Candidatus Neomarinimicrobiota bacterium]|tara:strand:- start:408 stop:1511 length:1104 start_codon:yes stop_codon:yes gene_type:complete